MSNIDLWGNIEKTPSKIDDKIQDKKELSIEDFSNQENRDLLIKDWMKKNIIEDVFKELSIQLQDLSEEEKENILQVFTQNSKLLDSKNSYLNNPIKGMRLISNIIDSKEKKEKNKLEELFEKFDNFLNKEFIEFSSKISIENEAELYRELLTIRDEMYESIKFSELINKKHIGIGGSFSAGKSSFLNSILNRDINAEDILPIDSVPTTSIPTYIVKKQQSTSDSIDIYSFNKNGEKSKIDKESLLAISHEFNKIYKFGLISIINKIVVDVDSMPYENIAFLDTPGYSKADGKENIDNNIAQKHLQNIDSMIWLIDADNGVIRNGDMKFIKSLEFRGDILFIINKADKKPEKDIKEIIDVTKESLKRANISFVDVVAYSSHDKEEYFSSNKIESFLKSRNNLQIINFESKIIKILIEYKNHIKQMQKNSSDVLKVLNQIDLYGEEIIDSVDNFDELLQRSKKEVIKHKSDEKSYENIKKEIIEIVEKVDASFNKNLDTNNIYNKAKKYKEAKEYINAIEKYSYLIKLNPNNMNNYLPRAICFFNLSKYEEALTDLKKVNNLNKYFANYFYLKAECYRNLGKNPQAYIDYKKAIELNSTDADCYYQTAKNNYKFKKYTQRRINENNKK